MNEDEFKPSPAWKHAATQLFSGRYGFGDIVPHEELQAALGMPKPTGRVHVEVYESWRLKMMSQVQALSDHLLEERQMCLSNVIGKGYLVLEPAAQTGFAVKRAQKELKSALHQMGRRLSFIDRAVLTSEQAKENADALARLSFLEQQVKRARRMNLGDDPKQIAS